MDLYETSPKCYKKNLTTLCKKILSLKSILKIRLQLKIIRSKGLLNIITNNNGYAIRGYIDRGKFIVNLSC